MKKQKFNLLIVDDHPVLREGVASVLKGHVKISSVKEANNGGEALALLEKGDIDIVLLDIKMEPLNGIETMTEINNRFPEIKVIVLSNYSDKKLILQMMKLGVAGYLLKKVDKEEIKNAVNAIVNGSTFFPPEISKVISENLEEIDRENTNANHINKDHLGKLHEIIYLLYLEKTTAEIAEILFLSKRTIEDYRLEILKMTKSKNIVGVIKYALAHGIVEDATVKKNVEEHLRKSHNSNSKKRN
jgi:DNA-binding NarL/FixJ family response regulator